MSYAVKRQSAERFAAIKQYLEDHPIEDASPLRVLDFGCLDGYFAQRFAEDGAAVTAVDDSTIFDPATINPRITSIVQHVEADEISDLGEFDVVLCLSVLHHLPSWRKYVTAFKKAGTVLFIEVANPDEVLPKAKAHKQSGRIHTAVAKLGELLTQTPGYDKQFERDLFVVDQRP